MPSPQGWALLADVYSLTYWLAARHRWMDLVEVAPIRQAWAAGHPHEVIRIADELFRTDTGLPATRIFPSRIYTARAHLDLGDRDSAQASLVQAWDIAAQRTKVDPMAREVLRVLISLSRRSNPQLVKLAKQVGLTA